MKFITDNGQRNTNYQEATVVSKSITSFSESNIKYFELNINLRFVSDMAYLDWTANQSIQLSYLIL